jgi:hypothetical protein
MVIIETSVFTRRIKELLDDDSYSELQGHLIHAPDAGDVIRNSGGIRKVRWSAKGHGKRGGVRVIYYWQVSADQIYMLYVYPKNEQENLTPEQLKVLRKHVKEEFGL